MTERLVRPHGGTLVDRMISVAEAPELERILGDSPRVPIDQLTAMDALNIAVGAYSPLTGFMGEEDYGSVVASRRLASGLTWTVPIMLHVPAGMAARLRPGGRLVIVDADATPFAVVDVQSVFDVDKAEYASSVFGTTDPTHPGVDRVLSLPATCVGGPLTLLSQPHIDGRKYFLTPRESRKIFEEHGWHTIAAFHTRNVPHRAHEYLQKLALEHVDGLFIHPIVGWKKSGDFSQRAQFESYEALIESYFPARSVVLGGFYSQVRYSGPREAVFHAIVRQNYGCSHLIIGRDHAGVAQFYGMYDSHRAFDSVHDLEITPLRYAGPYFCRRCGGTVTDRTCPHDGDDISEISGTLVRQYVTRNEAVPEHLLRPEVLAVIKRLATEEAFVK